MTSISDHKPCERCGRVRIVTKSTVPLCLDCSRARPPRRAPENADQLAGYSVRRAQQLACLVRDEGRDGIGDFLDGLDQQQMYGLVVALAAMVPVDQTPRDLLAWVHALHDTRVGALVPEVAA